MKFSEIYENILTMLYIIVLVVTTITIILYSKNIYAKVDLSSLSYKDLDTAMAYINVKVRQNDLKDGIFVASVNETGENALVIRKDQTDTWIFENNGKLLESKVLVNEQPKIDNAIKISNISDFEINKEGRLISYSIQVNEKLSDSTSIYLRSGN